MDPIIAQTNLPRDTLAGQTIVLTGAGRGIGREAALCFAWLGARVVIAEVSNEGRHTEQLIRDAGGQALFCHTDVSDTASVDALVAETNRAFGPVDILVNNAIVIPVASVVDMDVDVWDRTIAVNLRGTFLTCRAFLPDMLRRGRGVIVNLVSTDAIPGLSAYIASKQGIAGFSQSLAAEVGSMGVRVIAFGPGMVDTPAIRGVAPQLAPRLGFDEHQFLGLSLHPAYDGLMPAGHAGAATAYLAAVLADEYHGEVANGYTVLERAGVIGAPQVPQADAEPAAMPAGQASALQAARELCTELCEIVAQTGAEFTQLPIFARPMARSGFKSKSGSSLQDWERTLDQLGAQLAQAQAGDAAALAALRAGRERLQKSLSRLQTYYAGVPAETARFTRDQAMLQEVARISAQRVRAIEALDQALQAC